MKKLEWYQSTEFLRENNAIERVYDEDSLDQAWVAWKWLMGQAKLTPSVILKTHKILMLNQSGLRPNEKGYFRKVSVSIGGREAMHHSRIEEAVEEFCRISNLPSKGVEDMENLSKQLHVFYENVHPFVDGNGRTGRMFMNWWRLRNDMPLLIIHEGPEQEEYYGWFN